VADDQEARVGQCRPQLQNIQRRDMSGGCQMTMFSHARRPTRMSEVWIERVKLVSSSVDCQCRQRASGSSPDGCQSGQHGFLAPASVSGLVVWHALGPFGELLQLHVKSYAKLEAMVEVGSGMVVAEMELVHGEPL